MSRLMSFRQQQELQRRGLEFSEILTLEDQLTGLMNVLAGQADHQMIGCDAGVV